MLRVDHGQYTLFITFLTDWHYHHLFAHIIIIIIIIIIFIYLFIVLYSVPAAGRLAPQLACRQPPSLPHAVQNVLLLWQ